jgi:hypothetical protein
LIAIVESPASQTRLSAATAREAGRRRERREVRSMLFELERGKVGVVCRRAIYSRSKLNISSIPAGPGHTPKLVAVR